MAPLRALGVPVHLVKSSGPRDLRWILGLRSLLRRGGYEIVHVHSPVPAAALRVISRLPGTRTSIVYTEHNRWPRHSPTTRVANYLTFGLNHATLAVSDDVRQSMPRRVRRRVEVLTHGVDLTQVRAFAGERAAARRELGVVGDTTLIGIVANCRREKRLDIWIAAACAAARQEESLAFVAAGQGPLEADLRASLAEHQLGDRVRMLGYRSDAQRLMAGFDAFTLTSDHEGLPVALMDALALGLPVIATRAGGIPEVVSDGVNGLLSACGDAGALAAAYTRVARDGSLRERLGRAAKASGDQFDAATATAHIEAIYIRLASR